MELYSKRYDTFSRQLLFSTAVKRVQEAGPLNFFRFSAPVQNLSDIDFWYLFIFFNQAPGIEKPFIAKKKSRRAKANKLEIVVDFPRTQYSRVILRLFTFLLKFKDRDDFCLTKFSQGGETRLNIKNCTINDFTKALALRSNFFVDDIFLSLRVSLHQSYVQFETTYADFILELLHRLSFVIFCTKY